MREVCYSERDIRDIERCMPRHTPHRPQLVADFNLTAHRLSHVEQELCRRVAPLFVTAAYFPVVVVGAVGPWSSYHLTF